MSVMSDSKITKKARSKARQTLKELSSIMKREGASAAAIDALDENDPELLAGFTKLYESAGRDRVGLSQLREFETLLVKKGVVEKRGVMADSNVVMDDIELTGKPHLTPEEKMDDIRSYLELYFKNAKEASKLAVRKLANSLRKASIETQKDEADLTGERQAGKETRMRVFQEVLAKLSAVGAGIARSEARTKEAGGGAIEGGAKESGDATVGKSGTKAPSGGAGGGDEVKAKDTKLSMATKRSLAQMREKLSSESTIDHRTMSKENVVEMEQYFQLRRQQAMESAAEEDRRLKEFRKRGKRAQTAATKYREFLLKVAEARKGVGTQKSVSAVAESVYGGSEHHPPSEAEGIYDTTESVSTFRHLLYSSEDVKERPGPDGPGPSLVRYKLAMHSSLDGSKATKTLELWQVPKTGAAIKERIQRQFLIPLVFQFQLTHAGKQVGNSDEISSIGLKPGGQLQLNYYSEGELEEVRVTMKWYEYVQRFGSGRHPSIFTGMPVEYCMICYQGISECLAERLARDLLMPWHSPVKQANLAYFMQQHGIKLVLDMYEALIQETWRTMVLRHKLIEPGCIQILASLGSNSLNQQKVIDADGHGFVLQSFLRVLVHPRGAPFVDTSGAPGPPQNNRFMLKEVLGAAVQFFVNYRECSEIHMDICSKTNAVDQVINIAHCLSFSLEQAQGCMCLLACCMHSLDTHKWLCRNHTLEGIADCVRVQRERGGASSEDIALLHYYAQVTLAHLVITSVHVMARKVTEKLLTFMEDFLRSTTHTTIQQAQRKLHPHTGWAPFFPYLKVLLSPPKAKPDVTSGVSDFESVTISRLVELSHETMLFVVQVMSTADPHRARRQLLEEKTLPYALCLSANVPAGLLPGAKVVVKALRSESVKPVPIPKLSVMARAKLGAVHFGLKKVLDRTAEELKLEVSPPPPRPVRVPYVPSSNSSVYCIMATY